MAVGAVAIGYVLSRWADGVHPAAWFGAACLACAAAGVLRGRTAGAALLAALMLLSAGWFHVRIIAPMRVDQAWIASAGAERGMPVRVRGMVLHDPVLYDPRESFLEPAAGLRLRIEVIEGGAAARAGVLEVRAPARALRDVTAGDRLRVTGMLRGIESALNPGERDARFWAAQDHVRGRLVTSSSGLVERIEEGDGTFSALRSWWLASRADAKRRASEALLSNVPIEGTAGRGRAMLAALVLGIREREAEVVQEAYTRIGLAHVMAISGFHLAVMAGVVMVGVRLTGDRGALEPIIVAGLVLAYMLIVPSNAPILRAGIMVLAVLAADAMGRRYDRVSILAYTAMALLLIRPMDLWSMGFQLSFGLVATLMWVGPRAMALFSGERIITDMPEPSPWWRWPLMWLKGLFVSSVLCWIVALPLVLYHTGNVSPLAVVSTVLVLPLTVVLMWVAFAGVAAAVLVPGSMAVVGPVMGSLAEVIVRLVEWIDAMPWAAFWLPRVSVWWTMVATAAGLLWFWRGRVGDGVGLGAMAVAALWLMLEVATGPRLPGSVVLRVDALAVGNGTCMIVRSGSQAWFWDCGSDRAGIGQRLVPRAARELGLWRMDGAIITHPNEDHFEGLPAAAGWLEVPRVFVGQATLDAAERHATRSVGQFMRSIQDQSLEVQVIGEGHAMTLSDDVRLRILSPPQQADWPMVNDHSLVAMVEAATHGGVRRVLLTGDIQARAIEHLLRVGDLRADVLELPHHGSVHDAALRLLASVDPDVVIQSGGANRAHDPRWFGQRRMRAWAMTAEHGASWVEIRRDGSIWRGSYREPRAVRVAGPGNAADPMNPRQTR